jgi:MFS family permease
VLGSFFWGYIMTQLLGGRLAERFGPKRVFLTSILAAAVVTVQIPTVAPLGIHWVLVLRFLQGVCQVQIMLY